MARDRIKVAIGKTLNLGNYESYRIDVGVDADVREGETLESAYRKALKQAQGFLDSHCGPIEEALEKKTADRKK